MRCPRGHAGALLPGTRLGPAPSPRDAFVAVRRSRLFPALGLRIGRAEGLPRRGFLIELSHAMGRAQVRVKWAGSGRIAVRDWL
jgi:hypothetical protein